MENVTIIFTQDEVNALFTAICVRVNDFTEQMKQAGINGDTNRVLECAKLISIMESAQMKLIDKYIIWC